MQPIKNVKLNMKKGMIETFFEIRWTYLNIFYVSTKFTQFKTSV